MMELLILKAKNGYLRIKGGQCFIVQLDKASVFPMDQLEKVKKLKAESAMKGLRDIHIKKLVLAEKDL